MLYIQNVKYLKPTFNLPNCSPERKIVETYVSGKSWYRLYSDGWVEQGGQVTGDAYNNSTNNITFHKEFANTNYEFLALSLSTNSDAWMSSCWGQRISATQGRIRTGKWNTVETANVSWFAAGYAKTTPNTHNIINCIKY